MRPEINRSLRATGPCSHNGGTSVSEPDALNLDQVARWPQEGGRTYLRSAPVSSLGGGAVSSRADAARGGGERETFSEAVTWARESVGKIGKDRTIQLIRVYAEQGVLSPRVADGLINMMALLA